MEITITIKQNDYVTPTQCRQEVVQAICDAFLSNGAWSDFRPFSASAYRPATLKVIAHTNGRFYGFLDKQFDSDKGPSYNIRGCEMKAAFDCLLKAGYHIFQFYQYNDYRCKAYRVSQKPFLAGVQDAREVFSFDDVID